MPQPMNKSNRPLLVVAALDAIAQLTAEEAAELGTALFTEWRESSQASTAVAVNTLAVELGLYVTDPRNAYARMNAGRKVLS